jgi:hypothetical protein
MIQALARRFRQWIRRPELPVGDVAGESWSHVGPLPPAPLMGLEEPALIPLDLPVPPPLPMDARPPKTREEREWEALLAKMLSRPDAAAAPDAVSTSDTTPVDPDPTPTAPLVTQPLQVARAPVVEPPTPVVQLVTPVVQQPTPVVKQATPVVQLATPVVHSPTPVVSSADPTLKLARQDPAPELAPQDDDDWDAVIARARARVSEPNPPAVRAAPPNPPAVRTARPVPAPAAIPEPVLDDGDWETLIAAAKSRPVPKPARPAATLVRTPPPVRLTFFARELRPARQDEDRAWEELIARAKRRATNAPAPPVAASNRRPGHETGDWSAVIAAAKLRHGLHGRV